MKMLLIIAIIDSYKVIKHNNVVNTLRMQSSFNDFYENSNIITTTTMISELPFDNITTTEWSVYLDIHKSLVDQSNAAIIMSNLIEQKDINDKNNNVIKIDKGTSNSIDTLNELYLLNNNYEYHLNIFRRNIALRANRVLHPANNAQTFSTLINLMISNMEWQFALQVCEYIGLTPATYCSFDNESNTFTIDINTIANYVARYLLELRIEVIADKNNDRVLVATNNEKERRFKESVQEWYYTQVHRSDMMFRTSDCVLAVLRLSLRYATHTSNKAKIIVAMDKIDQVLLDAGVILNNNFLKRAKLCLQADIEKLMFNPNVSIIFI
jgi:hypothetical protein